ncbi:EAL domain-containing protein [Eisenbergiella sp.]
MQKKIMPIILVVALLVTGHLSLISIHGLQGNSRVINYTGVVRGATQRLVKQELNGQQNDALIKRLDGILTELATGEGENDLVRLDDDDFQSLVARMQEEWEGLKGQIVKVRQGERKTDLYELSEEYFSLADKAVCAAEEYSERRIERAKNALLALNGVFMVLAVLLAWLGAIQSRRQQELRRAEDENRRKSENLTRMAMELQAPMDEISELMYVSDTENYELLFLNEAGRKLFGVTELNGQKCYKVLQGKESPCEFCTTHLLKDGENYTWEHTNPITKKHYLLKDRRLQWAGRPARIEIAFDITEAEAEKQTLKYMLDGEMMMMECVRTLYQKHDIGQSLPIVMERLGEFLAAERTYLILVRDSMLYNAYEWCAQGVKSQQKIFQGLPLSVIDCWISAFSVQECVIIEDITALKEAYPQTYELLKRQNIHSLAAAPMEQEGQLKGFIGVDNPPAEQMRSIVPLLQTLCYFIMLTYRRTESELQLSRLSYYDTLTSFYNRNRFIKDSEELSAGDRPVGIVFLDVNGLKDINDRFGHAYGDKTLIECARQMREVFQKADYYRIGGDEFVIICQDIDRESFDKKVAALRYQFSVNTLCKAAIGSQWSSRFTDMQQLISGADARMYEDKKDFYRKNSTSNRYRHHSDEMLQLSDPDVLREEILKNRFEVFFQPKIAASSRCAVGAEALIRYRPQSGTLVMPGNFLPLLEESQTISQIDFYVFKFVCSRIKEWLEEGKMLVPISVNFSRSSLAQPDFVERLNALCREYGVDKKYLEIEITETIREADGVDFRTLVDELRQSGFIVSIDDFGTEYANLALLSNVDFDVLKLDRSLVYDVARNVKARTVVESIIEICRKMNIQVVAEGIETEEQLAVLRACGVELAQGFLFSRPVPLGEYEKKYLRQPEGNGENE